MTDQPHAHTITVTIPEGGDLSIYARLFRPVVGLIIELDVIFLDGSTATMTAVATDVDNDGISYVIFDEEGVQTAGWWELAVEMVDTHPELHTITHTRWESIARIHIW